MREKLFVIGEKLDAPVVMNDWFCTQIKAFGSEPQFQINVFNLCPKPYLP